MKLRKYRMDALIIYILYFVTYACMYVWHYATDTIYALTNADIFGKGINYSTGRFGCEVVFSIARFFNMDYEKSFVFLITIMILTFAFFSTITSIHIQDLLNVDSIVSKCIIIIALVLVFANVFAQEWFVFWECSFQWVFCVLFLSLAILQIKKVMKVKNYIFSFVFLTLGLGFYQAILPIFLILGCTIIYLKNDGILKVKAFIETAMIVIIGGLSSIVNLLSIKIFQILGLAYVTSRTENINISLIIKNLKTFIYVLIDMVRNAFGFYPKHLFALLSLVLIIGSVVNIVKHKEKIFNKFCYMFLLIIFSIFSVFIPHLFTTSLWLVQRSLVAFWTVASMLILVYWKTSYENIIVIKVGIVTATIMLLANFAMIQNIEMNLVVCNTIDQQNAIVIQEKIQEYEEATGKEIKFIAVMYDENVTYTNPAAKYRYCDTNRAFLTTSWSDVASINYFNKKNYIKVEMPKEIYIQYSSKDWDYFDPNEQLYFNEDTMYLIVY